jgi:hypothetical protein
MSKSNRPVQWLGIALVSGSLLGCGPNGSELELRTERNALKNQLEAAHSELSEANDQLSRLRTIAAQLEARNGGLSFTVAELEAGF